MTADLPASPPAEWIDKAAGVPVHYYDTAKHVTRTDVLSLADAEQVLAAIWPDVLALAAQREEQT